MRMMMMSVVDGVSRPLFHIRAGRHSRRHSAT
jgi:hypothetical protein